MGEGVRSAITHTGSEQGPLSSTEYPKGLLQVGYYNPRQHRAYIYSRCAFSGCSRRSVIKAWCEICLRHHFVCPPCFQDRGQTCPEYVLDLGDESPREEPWNSENPDGAAIPPPPVRLPPPSLQEGTLAAHPWILYVDGSADEKGRWGVGCVNLVTNQEKGMGGLARDLGGLASRNRVAGNVGECLAIWHGLERAISHLPRNIHGRGMIVTDQINIIDSGLSRRTFEFKPYAHGVALVFATLQKACLKHGVVNFCHKKYLGAMEGKNFQQWQSGPHTVANIARTKDSHSVVRAENLPLTADHDYGIRIRNVVRDEHYLINSCDAYLISTPYVDHG